MRIKTRPKGLGCKSNTKTHKTCPRCKKWVKRISKNDAYCMQCKSKFNVLGKNRRYKENRWKLWAYLVDHPCIDCGETNPVLLEFDHNSGKNKRGDVSRMICDGYAWTTILTEIQKCSVRCANCHRLRTTRQLMHAKHLAFRLGVASWKQSLATHRKAR